MKTLKSLDLMPLIGGALRGEPQRIITQTPTAAHARIERIIRGWRVQGVRDGATWTIEGMLPGVSGTLTVERAP